MRRIREQLEDCWQNSFLRIFIDVSMGLGLAGTLVSLMASDEFKAGNGLMELLGIALRTTVIGVVGGILVTVLFGDLLWKHMQGRLRTHWKKAASRWEKAIKNSRTKPKANAKTCEEAVCGGLRRYKYTT